jgi:L-fucose mutarotase
MRDAILDAVPIEAATVMAAPDGTPEPPIFAEFRTALGGIGVHGIDRFAFYAAARADEVALVVATGDQRSYANLMLTIGVRPLG